jgi:hypothetical protein
VNGGRAETFGRRYVFSTIDQSELAAQIRVNYAITPDLTLETYLEPFASSGRFHDFGELPESGSYELRYYGTDGTTISAPDAQGRRQVTDGASSFTISNPDFNVRSFRSNMVMRWEWRPGSTLFVVWNRSGSDPSRPGLFAPWRDLSTAFGSDGNHVFMIKMNYWLGL